jgi:hypothetical protein
VKKDKPVAQQLVTQKFDFAIATEDGVPFA